MDAPRLRPRQRVRTSNGVRAVRRERRDARQRRPTRPAIWSASRSLPPHEGAALSWRSPIRCPPASSRWNRGSRRRRRDSGRAGRSESESTPTGGRLVGARRLRSRRAARRPGRSSSRRASARASTSSRYVVRATTAGTFSAAPTHAEEMYEPEVFGRTATTMIEVRAMKRRLLRTRRLSALVVAGGRRGALGLAPPRSAARRPARPRRDTVARRSSIATARRSTKPLSSEGSAQRCARRRTRCRAALVAATLAAEDGASTATPASTPSPSPGPCWHDVRATADRRGRIDDHPAGGEAAAQSRRPRPALAAARRRSARRSSRCASSTGSSKREILALYLNLAPYGNQHRRRGAREPRVFRHAGGDGHARAGGLSGGAAAAARRASIRTRHRAPRSRGSERCSSEWRPRAA